MSCPRGGALARVAVLACAFAVTAPAAAFAAESSGRADPGPYHAQQPVNVLPATVPFENGSVDLTKRWGAAHSCVIWESADASRCFQTDAQANAYTKQVQAEVDNGLRQQHAVATEGGLTPAQAKMTPLTAQPQVAAATCSGYARFWRDENYNGDRFQARDKGWQNLPGSFNDAMSSFILGPCAAHLAENGGGGGLYYPCDTSGGARHPEMDIDGGSGYCSAQRTSWNDRVSSIDIY